MLFNKKQPPIWCRTGYDKYSYLASAFDRHEGKSSGTSGGGATNCSHKEAMLDYKMFLKRTSPTTAGTLPNMNIAEVLLLIFLYYSYYKV